MVARCTSPLENFPPWTRVIVGAPKKTKRGDNLRKGGSGYVARLGGDTGQASQSRGLCDRAEGIAQVAVPVAPAESSSVVGVSVESVSSMPSQELSVPASAVGGPSSDDEGRVVGSPRLSPSYRECRRSQLGSSLRSALSSSGFCIGRRSESNDSRPSPGDDEARIVGSPRLAPRGSEGRRSPLGSSVRSASSGSGFRIGRRSDSSGSRSPIHRASALDVSSDEGVVIGRRDEVSSGLRVS